MPFHEKKLYYSNPHGLSNMRIGVSLQQTVSITNKGTSEGSALKKVFHLKALNFIGPRTSTFCDTWGRKILTETNQFNPIWELEQFISPTPKGRCAKLFPLKQI